MCEQCDTPFFCHRLSTFVGDVIRKKKHDLRIGKVTREMGDVTKFWPRELELANKNADQINFKTGDVSKLNDDFDIKKKHVI